MAIFRVRAQGKVKVYIVSFSFYKQNLNGIPTSINFLSGHQLPSSHNSRVPTYTPQTYSPPSRSSRSAHQTTTARPPVCSSPTLRRKEPTDWQRGNGNRDTSVWWSSMAQRLSGRTQAGAPGPRGPGFDPKQRTGETGGVQPTCSRFGGRTGRLWVGWSSTRSHKYTACSNISVHVLVKLDKQRCVQERARPVSGTS